MVSYLCSANHDFFFCVYPGSPKLKFSLLFDQCPRSLFTKPVHALTGVLVFDWLLSNRKWYPILPTETDMVSDRRTCRRRADPLFFFVFCFVFCFLPARRLALLVFCCTSVSVPSRSLALAFALPLLVTVSTFWRPRPSRRDRDAGRSRGEVLHGHGQHRGRERRMVACNPAMHEGLVHQRRDAREDVREPGGWMGGWGGRPGELVARASVICGWWWW